MADRSILHRSKLDEFLRWCATQPDLRVEDPKGDYVVGRVRKIAGGTGGKMGKAPILIYENHRSQHLTVSENGIALVRKFINHTRNVLPPRQDQSEA